MSYNGYRDLKVYQGAYKLAMDIFQLTKKFPLEEKYSLVDQMRRSSRSVPANIAEAWKKRLYEKMFISKLIDAAGEAGETEVWLDFSKDIGCLSSNDYDVLFSGYQDIQRMLNGMIEKSEKFCTKNS